MDTVNELQRIDQQLDNLLDQWERLPEVAATIATWSVLEQIEFIEEWPIQEDQLKLLADRIAKKPATAQQRTRYAELLQVVATNRPIITRLQNS